MALPEAAVELLEPSFALPEASVVPSGVPQEPSLFQVYLPADWTSMKVQVS